MKRGIDMGKPLITVGSITRAMRARDLLARHGIDSYVERAPHRPGVGCGYGVHVPAREREALALLHGAGFLTDAGGGAR